MRVRKLARLLPSNLNNYTAPQNLGEGSEVGSNEIEGEIDSKEKSQPEIDSMEQSPQEIDFLENYKLTVETIENPEMSDFSSSSRPLGSKRGRGIGKLPRGWGDQGFKKLRVCLNEEGNIDGDIIGYASACGVLARTTSRLPLHYSTWHAVPRAQKDDVWKEIQRNTTVPSQGRGATLKMLASYWRKFKSHIKRAYYEPHKNEVNPLCEDTRVDENQWRMLVDYWRMEETQKRAEKNKRNRGKKNSMYHHRNGRIRNKMVNEGQST